MAEAFRCDGCGEFHTGKPWLKLENPRFKGGIMNTNIRAVHLCEECLPEFEERYQLQDGEET